MSNRILYVEDDETLGLLTFEALVDEGYEVVHCLDGAIARKEFKNEVFDLCIIDVMLPKIDGFQLAEFIRDKNSQIPIIFVTAKSLQEDKIHGLKIGADDYITKPFSIEELILKINIFLKRKFFTGESKSKAILLNKLNFDFANLTITYEEKLINVTQREGELLNILAAHKNEILERKILLERLWGKEDYFLGRSMDVFISRLRKHLSLDPDISIENIHGVGFRLNIPE